MNKKKLTITSLLALSASTLLMVIQSNNFIPTYGDLDPYVLLLDSNAKINSTSSASLEEVSKNILTSSNNSIVLSGYKIVNNATGWQTVLPGGYIYNPVTNTGHNNKISGLKSIKYTGNGSLELHYGYSLNNEEILYSFEETILAGEAFTFTEQHPSFFYLKNVSESNVDIANLEIKYSCEEESYPLNNLKVLMIGNSFADDTIFYSKRIANSLGIDIDLYDAYIAGCTIDNHYSNIQNQSATYSMRSTNGTNWVYANNKSLNEIVASHTWDIITFQQASAEVGRPGSYSNLENLVNEVKKIATGNPKYYWHQTWAYDQDYSEYYDYFSYFNNDSNTMFNALVDCYNSQVQTSGLFEKTIFNGTAVQNLRTSYMKNTFSRDGKHMSLVHGRYLLGSNFISSIYGIDLDLTPVQYLPTGMNRSFLEVVNESCKNARKNPNNITNSRYENTEMSEYDLTSYTEIDAELVGCSYWNCQDSTNYNKRINHNKDVSNIYASTKRFSIDTLPIGSLIFIQEGFGCRPEAWTNDAVQGSRKTETYDNVIEVTSDFWNGYQYRAFNLFKSGKQTLSAQYIDEQYDEVFDAFHIYVPNDAMEYSTPKTYNPKYYEDKNRFDNNELDIDDYELIHLDPITGFYKCDSYYYLMNSYVDDTAQKFVCTRPFFTADGELGAGTVIIVDSGYQYRSDCWGAKGTYSPRPNNITTNFTILDSSFMSPFRKRTFNVSSTSSNLVGQNSTQFMSHLRIYKPIV